MKKHSGIKVAALAASIALAMGSTAVMAAAPTTTQLPGAGKVVLGAATGGTITTGAQTITFTGNTVINWGVASGATINATSQPGGFNVGSAANLAFSNAASASVLNVDVSGNPSQIFGTLSMSAGGGNLYVANSNGIIVGATAQISGPAAVGLIANARGTIAFDGTASAASIEYQGAGGDVSVAKGATLNGTTVLVSGGGTVNVDLSALASGNATLAAGVKNSTSTLVNDNTAATLAAAGSLGGATLASFASAGNASSSGTLGLGSNARVDGALTNTGTLTLGTGFAIKGGLVNNKTVAQSASVSMGSLTNNGAYDGGANYNVDTTAGGISNGGGMTHMGHMYAQDGDFTNNGQIDTNSWLEADFGNFTNNGQITGASRVDVYYGGNFVNKGTIALNNGLVYVLNGSIVNNGTLSGVNDSVETASDTTAGNGFTKGADYSITNTGTITATGDLYLNANSSNFGNRNGAKNDSTGSVINTGVLQVGTGGSLYLGAYNDVNLAGTVQALSGGKYKALSALNPLGFLDIEAGDFDLGVLNTTGVATLATDIVTSGGADVYGDQVKLLSNLSSIDATGAPVNTINIVAGAASATDYAVRVASGKTVTANSISVDGDQAGDEPNVIVQGTLAADNIRFGNSSPVGDVFTGPTGSLVMSNTPYLYINSTGRVKTVPYNNASNFRFNGLAINVTDGSKLRVDLDPSAYQTNGTSNGLSAVNLLVNSDVMLDSLVGPAPVTANGSAVTGVTNTPNTHLVLQASGNIEVGAGGNFYWPGYVYLGNVAADANGNALPGTLGLGTIKTDGTFNNVLPGDIAGASGIHFITQFPMTLTGDVVTNANAWVNFGTDLLTQAYATGTLAGSFFGGTQGAGTVVNYGALDASMFHTHAPVATK